MTRPYDLPSMTALTCFEAAARHASFKSAASELNVTPAAISHQIKALETDLAQPLFRRRHRGVELTEAGAYLFVALQRGFEGMSGAVREIRGRGEGEDVVIHATTAMSAFWLTPRIASFWSLHPDIAISQIVSDVGAPGDRVDLSIHYGPVADAEAAHRFLFRDHVVALGTEAYAQAYGVRSVEDLVMAPLIHMTASEQGWTGWAEWLAAFDLPAPTGQRLAVNNHMIALQLAQDGLGAVLGWTGLVGPLLERGGLVELVPERLPSPHAYYLKMHPRVSAKARIFADWLAEGSV